MGGNFEKNNKIRHVLPVLFDIRPVNTEGNFDLKKIQKILKKRINISFHIIIQLKALTKITKEKQREKTIFSVTIYNMSLLLSVDSQITDFINHIIPHTTVFNTLFSFLSLKGDSIVIWLLLLLITVIFNKKMNYKFYILFFLVFLTTVFINDILLKNIFQRTRPIVDSSSCPLNFSFPSGHSACAFALAYVFFIF